MAKKSMIARDVKRQKKSKNTEVRQQLKEKIKDLSTPYEEKIEAAFALSKRDRNESVTRVRRRCRCCGRPRSVFRLFGLCRICLRKAAMEGYVPGLTKSSW